MKIYFFILKILKVLTIFFKTYVQDRVEENSSEVYDLIVVKKGHLYICGDVRMAADLTKTLENILKVKGNMTMDQAKEYINDMKVII